VSLLTICTNAANNAGVNVPAAIVGNADPAAARLLQLARDVAWDLSERVNWTALTVENVFIANGTSDYLLPTDFRSIVNDTLWDRSRFWRMRGAMSPQQWQMFKSSIIGRATIERRWRIRLPSGDPAGAAVQFEIDPPITGDTASTFVYEYVSKNWCASTTTKQAVSAAVVSGGTGYKAGDTIVLAGGTETIATVITVIAVGTGGVIMLPSITPAQITTPVEITTSGNYTAIPTNPVSQASTSGSGTGATFTMGWGNATQPDWAADTDIALLDERTIEIGVLWQLQHRLGLDYSEEKDRFERRVDVLIARDGGTATLDLAPYDRLTLVGPYNVPETGFGPQS
jgi:hypothetical protein